MIIIVKGKDYKRLLIKALSFISLFVMFYFYYQHMSDKFKTQNDQLVNKLNTSTEVKKQKKSKVFEDLIYKEASIIVDLVGQENVHSIKVVKNKLLLLMVCDYDSNLEPLMIRYGVNAFIKSTSKDIKIAIDLKTIVENKYEKN
ncbi:MAG: hypothetical protein U9O56_06665 [Campylobacterota bacterium]|nr:hypothetical protein [Campylobacterota bacterium]